jgi:pyruvate dehydrogenase kinase 2/3/4
MNVVLIRKSLQGSGVPKIISGLFHSAGLNRMPNSVSSTELKIYASKKQTAVSLKSLLETAKGEMLPGHHPYPAVSGIADLDKQMRIQFQIACFLHRELPVRLAHRCIALESLPILKQSRHIREVCSWYKMSFAQLRSCPVPGDIEKEEFFATVIQSIYDRHSATLITMAKGAHEVRQTLNKSIASFAEEEDIQTRLDDFYMSRIGIRMLIGQYLAVRSDSQRDMIGLVSLQASPYDIAQQAISDASFICARVHGDAPEVTIHGRTDLHFPYVGSHISYMLLELLKNSMRATVEVHGVDNMPPIRIVIADGECNEDVVIKVSDEGGGIPRSVMPNIWSYLFTTADPTILEGMLSDAAPQDFDLSSPLAGLGYGLPIARNYARYFGGDLSIMSMEGYGTDSFIYLPRLSDHEETGSTHLV